MIGHLPKSQITFRPSNIRRIGLLEGLEHVQGEFSKLMSNHILCDRYIVVYLPIVYLKLEAHKIWKYRRRSRLGLDRRNPLTRFGPHDWEAIGDTVRDLK
jgi:hypothetical protein